jgi:hypothetical protein
MALFDDLKSKVQSGQGYAGMIKIDPASLKTLGDNMTKWQQDQIPFATALALTRTAQRVRAAEIEWMQSGFVGGAIPWTLKSLYLKRAEKNRLAARVWFIDYASKGTPAGEYLKPQVHGGGRAAKRGEKAIRSRHKLASGRFLVPGRYVPKDSYGNVKGARATMQKVLANIRGGRDDKTDTKKGKGTTFFLGIPKGRSSPAGVWERRKKKLRLYAVETAEPQYRDKFDFFGISERTVEKWYDKELTIAFNHAIKTARK